MSFLKNLFKKKRKPPIDELDEALRLRILEWEEILKIRAERAEKTYKDFLTDNKKK